MARIQLVTNTDIFLSHEFELPAKEHDKSFEYNTKTRERYIQRKIGQFRVQHIKFILRAKEWYMEALIDSKIEFVGGED
jgi:hypothetical protein